MPTTLTLTNPIHPPLAETVAPNRTMAGGGLYFALMLASVGLHRVMWRGGSAGGYESNCGGSTAR